MINKIKTGILGATGTVGQNFVALLQNHPWFEITALAASERSAGKTYAEACTWLVSGNMPPDLRDVEVQEIAPNLDCELVFSALPASVAGDIEEDFARAGYWVSSNARNHRPDPDVPLVVPEVNATHIDIIPHQRRNRGWDGGFIITNGNCSTIGLVLPLKPLHANFGIKKVMVVTMQALSGAGYPGVPSMDIIDNVVPYIGGEEDKMETEPLKMLGELKDNQFVYADFIISAQCHRVPVLNGHLEAVSIELDQKPSADEIIAVWEDFRAAPQELYLPSAPTQPIYYRREDNRPQPRLDRDAERGMATSVGRLRPCPILDYKFNLLSHNTVRGAAGGAILNAELLKAKGYLSA